MVIFPSSAMISTPRSAVREVALILILLLSNSCFRAGETAAAGQVLRHHQRRSAAGMKRVVNLVHEGLHVEDAAAARFHQILRIERITDLRGIEPFALVGDRDLQLLPLQLEGGVYFL